MKRSKAVAIIADWGRPEVLQDMYSNNYEEWADNLLYVLEGELGILPRGVLVKDSGALKDAYVRQAAEEEE